MSRKFPEFIQPGEDDEYELDRESFRCVRESQELLRSLVVAVGVLSREADSLILRLKMIRDQIGERKIPKALQIPTEQVDRMLAQAKRRYASALKDLAPGDRAPRRRR